MRPSVRVPVLSEQMLVAFPIVSQAARTRMKFCSSSICLVEYASEMVTANGRPSGTATTTMVTAMIAASTIPVAVSVSVSYVNRAIIITMNVSTAIKPPKYPIRSAMTSSLSCRGVLACSLFSSPLMFALILPYWEFAPVPKTTACTCFKSPVRTHSVLDKINGLSARV